VLTRTLESLAHQAEAERRLTVLLAMEESEPGARAKAQALKAAFEGRLAHFLVTYHPASLPGEVAGKGANQAWAARQARRELVDRLKIPLESMTLTSCDADSILHPHYFAELTRLFAADPNRHTRFWQAPLFFDSNVWEVSVIVRLLTFFTNAVHLAELVGPFAQAMPLSTYTLSYKLADQAGYWDPAVIAEDWHMFLRCFFATRGRARVTPIFLPTSGDAITGEGTWRSLAIFYRQQLRHAWGCQDVGYILQQWRRWPGTPFRGKLLRLTKVVHDHLIWTAGAVVVALGALLSLALDAAPVITLPPDFAYPVIAQAMNLLGALGTAVIWLLERRRVAGAVKDWRARTVARELLAWVTLPVMTFFMLGIPVVHAQTKMLFGSPLTYFRTPKQARRGDS
jgi:cellulose synthase/poly-beta-1,6-N-acetylglucosamine synthase-like glycosyltransferase